MGFIPGSDIKDSDFINCFTKETIEDIGEDISRLQQMANLPFQIWKYFIMAENSALSILWNFVDIFSCIFSSYFYAYLAAFGMKDPSQGSDGNDDAVFSTIEMVYESIFILSILKQFLTEYTPDGETQPVRDISKISKRYIKDHFVLDTICVIPFSRMLEFIGEEARLLYLIKSIRIIKGIRFFSVPKMMKGIKSFNAYNLDRLAKTNPAIGNDKNNDQIKISMIMLVSYTLRILKLVIILFNLSFFFGIAWHIYCNLANKIIHRQVWTEIIAGTHIEEEYFMTYYSMNDHNNGMQAIMVMYFAFTSLSTVGFGDFHPVNDSERLLCSGLLLFGVAIFSYIMGIFIEILEEFKRLNEGLDEGDSLSRFFLILQKFNSAKPINHHFQVSLQAHFDYRWDNDKTIALHTSEAQSILLQLPDVLENKIYVSFLFTDFL